jgi:hypothetical protein
VKRFSVILFIRPNNKDFFPSARESRMASPATASFRAGSSEPNASTQSNDRIEPRKRPARPVTESAMQPPGIAHQPRAAGPVAEPSSKRLRSSSSNHKSAEAPASREKITETASGAQAEQKQGRQRSSNEMPSEPKTSRRSRTKQEDSDRAAKQDPSNGLRKRRKVRARSVRQSC